MTIATSQDFPASIARPRLVRTRVGNIHPFRFLRGGRLGDAGRLPRYALIAVLASAALWAPIISYVKYTPPSFTSGVSLILPGSGAQASVNVAEIGQASSSASSAFSSSSISPTETYKRLLSANRLLDRAAARLGMAREALGGPKIKLVDQTSLIHFDMTGPSPAKAQEKAATLLSVFFEELDQLRSDELENRETGSQSAVDGYSAEVADLRNQIEAVKRDSGLASTAHYEDLVASRDRVLDRLEELRAKYRAAEAEVDALSLQLGVDPKTAALNLRLHADTEFLELSAKHSDSSAEFANLRGRYGSKHPQVTSAQRSRDGAQQKLLLRAVLLTGLETGSASARLDMAPDGERGDLLSKLVSSESLRSGLKAQLERLENQIVESDARLAIVAPKAAKLDDLTRDYQVAEAVLASALARTDTSKSDVYASYPLVQVLEDASMPDEPSSPKIKIAIAAGVVATFMMLAALTLAWVRRPLIDRILTRESGRLTKSSMTLPERIVYGTLVWTWAVYAIGGLYVVGPVLAWTLGGLAALGLYLGPAMRADLRPTGPVPWLVWLWFLGMAVMLVALWVGHITWDFGLKSTIKSSIGWAKGWALLALFPLAGAVLQIRRSVLIRAHCVLGLVTLCVLPLLTVAPFTGLPERIFTSPFKVIGGPGPEYFSVYLYTLDPASWQPRWQFYAPWSPFAGLLGVVMVLFAFEEKHRGWLVAGCLAGVLMILMSKSRMSLVALVLATVCPRLLPLMLRSWAWALGATLAASMAAAYTPLEQAVTGFVRAFKNSRADSTRVRETLQRIARERWSNEAVWFGHGQVERGPHLVEYMPIGSHHTWFALLFVKGVVGLVAFAVPFFTHLLVILWDGLRHARARLPLGVMLVFLILSMGENIEIEVYLLWPALMILGIHLREMEDGRAAAA